MCLKYVNKRNAFFVAVAGFILSSLYYYTVYTCPTSLSVELIENNEAATPAIICNILFPDRVCYFLHHKTGVRVTRVIFMWTIFGSYCKHNSTQSIKYLRCVDNKKSIDIETSPSEMRKLSMLNVTNKNTALLFHMTRDPVSTVISGYYYHLTASERFLNGDYSKKNINQMYSFFGGRYKNTTQIKNIYENLAYPKLKTNAMQTQIVKNVIRFENVNSWLGPRYAFFYLAIPIIFSYTVTDWSNINFYGFTDFIKNNIIINECETKYNFIKNNETYTFKQILRKTEKDNALKCGLYLEMMRYLFVTFIEQYEYYNLLNIKNKKTLQKYELKMEDFITNFDFNANQILDGLNMIDSIQNRHKLAKYSTAINISFERQSLFRQIKRSGDPHSAQNAKSHHIHIGRNNSIAIDVLLTANNASICRLFKYITPLIGYVWKYTQYC